MPNSPLIAVEEYLNSSYDPDVEFVDGVLVQRNVGDWLHSLIQSKPARATGCLMYARCSPLPKPDTWLTPHTWLWKCFPKAT